MSDLAGYLDLRYISDGQAGDYADPKKITDIGRVLKNANPRAVANSIVVKTGPGLCFGFTVSSVAAQFIQVFDLAALPADTAVPTLSFNVSATSTIGNEWMPPRAFQNGIVFCNSSTQHTKTIGSADCIFDVQFL